MANEAALTIQVPTQLENLGGLVQNVVNQLQAGTNWLQVVSSSVPVLFAEGAQWSEIQAEVKDPQAIVLGCLVVGQVVAALVAKKLASSAAATPAAPVAQ